MELRVDRLDRLSILSVDGDIDTSTASHLQEALAQELSAGCTQMVVDMTAVRYVSSMGLRVFLSQLKKLRGIGGRLVLSGCNDLVQDVFRISGFASFFEMATNIAEAQETLNTSANP
jgi:anti-sigma B factor antagonist